MGYINAIKKYILNLRTEFSKEAQGVKYIPIHDQWTKHPDYEIHPRQRIWFDVPILRYPAWQSIQILPTEFEQYLIEALTFMRANTIVENFAGFYDFEIAKVERNLSAFREIKDPTQLAVNRTNFVNYFNEYDFRKDSNLTQTFPELQDFYKLIMDSPAPINTVSS